MDSVAMTRTTTQSPDREADLIITARRVYTVDQTFSIAEALAVKDGRILAVGSRTDMEESFSAPRRLDLGDACLYPGFIDPHCHFLSYGFVLQRPWLADASSWEEAVTLMAASEITPSGWIQGRGWDHNRWPVKEFPDRNLLDRAFPNHPAIAIRVDGHAAVANARALAAAGLAAGGRVEGGVVAMRDGLPTGLLLDNAVDLVRKAIPAPSETEMRQALLKAQASCLSLGLCSVSNAGTELREVQVMDRAQEEGSLAIRIYAMLAPTAENIETLARRGPLAKDRLTARSFKLYADGALGSRGALLLEEYCDDPGNRGLLTLEKAELDRVCGIARACGYQMNVHAIGDRAAKVVLDAYERYLEPGNDLRWRIEHAQVLTDEDVERMAFLGVVPSVQTSHALSDKAWTEDRLGPGRMYRSHRYLDILERCGWLANGSDFPIEKADPLRGFRAAVFRKDDKQQPEGGWRPDQAIDRVAALKAMTIWAARANFEESSRGSLEAGKWADIVALDKDLLSDEENHLWEVTVVATMIGGELLRQN
jgi:predicted amidohydrolase YtcJ